MSEHSASSPQHLHRTGSLITLGSLVFIFVGLFGLLGGPERLLSQQSPDAFLTWPVAVFYFWPLCIPLGTYLVIARWTGDQHFRHA